LLVVGYTADGNLIVNDPYGNKFAPGYGSNDGQGVVYPWKRLTARRAVEVIGIWPPPTAIPTITPTSTATATPTHTPIPTNTPVPTHTPTSVPFIGPQAPSPSPSATVAP
jgi:hypothetical protein